MILNNHLSTNNICHAFVFYWSAILVQIFHYNSSVCNIDNVLFKKYGWQGGWQNFAIPQNFFYDWHCLHVNIFCQSSKWNEVLWQTSKFDSCTFKHYISYQCCNAFRSFWLIVIFISEPTNMLDMKAVIWLENYLQVCRTFLENLDSEHPKLIWRMLQVNKGDQNEWRHTIVRMFLAYVWWEAIL